MKSQLERLRSIIRSYGKVVVAFSGGCDSAFVLKVSRDTLGREDVKAVIAKSASLPARELGEARGLAREIDAELVEIETRELNNPNYAANSVQRCYFCKSELYAELLKLASQWNFPHVVNGTNRDDLQDWRPGIRAAQEYGVKSPLVEAGFTKAEIREASQLLGLSSCSKPAAACLSSRIPYGVSITPERLRQVEEGEALLKDLGFQVVRVRWFGERAEIEVGAEETQRFFQSREIRREVAARLRKIGFQTIDLNPEGYRSGRFNKVMGSGLTPLLG